MPTEYILLVEFRSCEFEVKIELIKMQLSGKEFFSLKCIAEVYAHSVGKYCVLEKISFS